MISVQALDTLKIQYGAYAKSRCHWHGRYGAGMWLTNSLAKQRRAAWHHNHYPPPPPPPPPAPPSPATCLATEIVVFAPFVEF